MGSSNEDEIPEIESFTWSDYESICAEHHREHQQLLTSCVNGTIPPADAKGHLVVAALIRSQALVQGFTLLLSAKNRFAAVPLIRLQLDSAMRVHACRIVDQPDHFVQHLLEGGKPSDYTKRNGINLSDSALHERLTELYENTSDLYKHTNGFIHLSDYHLFGIYDATGLRLEKLTITDLEELPPWLEDSRKEYAIDMCRATVVLTEECKLLIESIPRSQAEHC